MTDIESLEYIAQLLIFEKQKIIGDLDVLKYTEERFRPYASNIASRKHKEFIDALYDEKSKIDASYTKIYGKIKELK